MQIVRLILHLLLHNPGLNALSPETAKKLGNRPMPFPSNADMIMRCSDTVKNMAKGFIDNNSGLFK